MPLASGRGTSQFLNANFVFPTSPLIMTPYSTLGVGVLVKPTSFLTITSTVMNTADSSTTGGFEDFGEGTTWSTEAQFQYTLGDLPGGQNVGVAYAFDSPFTGLGDRFVFAPGEGISAPTTDETWAVYWSGWQYVWVKDASDKPIDLANGQQDRKGLGIFARVGFADDEVNPIEWSASAGVGGKGLIPGRERDTFGVGYFYLDLNTERLTNAIGTNDHTQGVEAYYNVSLTQAVGLTFDVQVLDSALPEADTGVILGLRLSMRF